VTQSESLHAVARDYLMRRRDHWIDEYRPPISDRPRGADYSDAAKDIYPRYPVLQAILDDVESFVGGDFSDLNEARQLLAEAGRTAENVFTDPPGGAIQQVAMAEERLLYVAYLDQVEIEDLLAAPRIPYRRTLRETEVESYLRTVEIRWEVTGRSWYPLAGDRPAGVEVFDIDKVPGHNLDDVLDRALGQLTVERAVEIREFGPSREADRPFLELFYNGAEGLFFDSSVSWLIYTSHEGTVTIGGDALIQAVTAEWPAWEAARWTGWTWCTGRNP
jgi:hypothetical protein